MTLLEWQLVRVRSRRNRIGMDWLIQSIERELCYGGSDCRDRNPDRKARESRERLDGLERFLLTFRP